MVKRNCDYGVLLCYHIYTRFTWHISHFHWVHWRQHQRTEGQKQSTSLWYLVYQILLANPWSGSREACPKLCEVATKFSALLAGGLLVWHIMVLLMGLRYSSILLVCNIDGVDGWDFKIAYFPLAQCYRSVYFSWQFEAALLFSKVLGRRTGRDTQYWEEWTMCTL